MRTVPFLAILLTLAIALPVQADHCTTWTTMGAVEIDSYYVIEDCYLAYVIGAHGPWCQNDGPWMALWIYEESNGLPGLQRGDEWWDDTCHGLIRADTIIL